jgi:hypothetical protein
MVCMHPMAVAYIGSRLGTGTSTSTAIGAGLLVRRRVLHGREGRRFWSRDLRGVARPAGTQPMREPAAEDRQIQELVEMRGLEPLTPAMRTRCSSS